jgi:hypothetical protein
VPLGDRQYAELQRRLGVVVSCTRCRLTFPYSAIGERSTGRSLDSTAERPAPNARRGASADLVLATEEPHAPQVFAPTADGPVVVPAFETGVDEEQPCLTVVESGSQERPAPRRSLGAIWRSLAAPGRCVIIGAVVLSLALIAAAVVYRITSAPPGQPPESSGAR